MVVLYLCLHSSMSSVVPSCVNLPAFIPPTNVTLFNVRVERQSSVNVFFEVRFDSDKEIKKIVSGYIQAIY